MTNPKPIQDAVNPDLRGSWPALHRAAQRAREVAMQTGTAIVVSRNGVIEYIHPRPETGKAQVQEPQGPYGDEP